MKKAFTLLELIIVIIIIGILATLGFTQYQRVVEKGRTAEARTILGQIRTAQVAYYAEFFAYATTSSSLGVNFPSYKMLGQCYDDNYYFGYKLTSSGTAIASRCKTYVAARTAKSAASTYTITIDYANGTFTGGY